jgi:hypothetical protein
MKVMGWVIFTYDAAKRRHWKLHVDQSHILTEAIQQDAGIHAFIVRHWSGKCGLDENIV